MDTKSVVDPQQQVKRKTTFLNSNRIALLVGLSALIMFGLMEKDTIVDRWIGLWKRLPGSFNVADSDRNILEIIESRGFRSEQHFVTTKDGYILQLVRIINPFVKTNDERAALKPVLLHHGFQYNGALWLIAADGRLDQHGAYHEFDEQGHRLDGQTTTGNSLGFVLATKGYDVWLATYRGGIYSTNHTTVNVDSSEFWRFSIDEMVKYDLPAQIDHILAKTGHRKLAYIGHSQGNLIMFAMLSVNDQYSRKIDPFVAISPVFYFRRIKTAMSYLVPFKGLLRTFPARFPYSERTRKLLIQMCQNHYLLKLCHRLYYQFIGSEFQNLIQERIPLQSTPSGSSSWNAAHLFQMVNSYDQDGCPYFDYGEQENMKIYGQPRPPFYDAGRINTTKIALIYTADDWFNHPDDIDSLRQKLLRHKGYILDDYQIPDPTYNHLDLILAKNVGEMVNNRVLRLLSAKN